MIEMLPEKGRFYKVNLHCHTNISDGHGTPEEVKAHYKALGYSAVCFTDHEVLLDHSALCDEDFIALHGYEVAIKQDVNRRTGWFMPVYHFNMIAKDPKNLRMPRFFRENPSYPGNGRKWMEACAQYDETIETTRYDKEWINDYLGAVKEAGFLIVYNHPEWSLQTREDYLGLQHLHGIEVSNGGCIPYMDCSGIHFQQMLRGGMRVVPVGGDDNHCLGDAGQAFTMIKAEELSYGALMDAFEKGHCYASEGPEILSLTMEDGKVKVRTSAVVDIVLRGEGRYADLARSGEADLTYAEFDYVPEKIGAFFRIELRDTAGNRAYSNAYYTDSL
jgi:hypothetical protein